MPGITYDCSLLTDKPSGGIAQTTRCHVIYGWQADGGGWWGDEHDAVLALPQRDRPLPDEARVKALVRAIGNRRDPLLIHLEEYTVGDDADHDGHAHEYRAYGTVARWCREADPRRLIGLCGGSPDGRNAAAGKRGAGLTFAQNLRLWRQYVAPFVDLVADLYYVFPSTDMAAWREWLTFRTGAIGALCKWQAPMLNATDLPGLVPDKVNGVEVATNPAKLAEAIDAVRGLGLDVSVWGHPRPYDRKADAGWRGMLAD